MEYFDLNLKAVDIDHWSMQDGIRNLITNAIRQYKNQSYFDNLKVEYDKNTNTLKISDDGAGINLNDFVQQGNYDQDNLATGLRLAISSLLANKVNIVFHSCLGTFTPIIHNKEGISAIIPDIFLTYEPKEAKQTKWFNLKSHNNDDDNENQVKKGTQVIISPLNSKFIKNLKLHFSFLLLWTKKIVTNAGYLLVAPDDAANNFFLNGANITYFDERGDSHENHFAFSYDANVSYFDEDLIKNNKYRIWEFIPICINAIYENLSDEDKENIFSILLNNHDCIEWKEPLIRKTIAKYYGSHHPNDYLIGVCDKEKDAFISFAKKENKTIIWLPTTDEYDELRSEGINTVRNFGQQYACEHYCNYVDIQDLSESETTNWNSLQDFLYYFIKHNEKIANALAKYHKESFDLKIVENLPDKSGIYLLAKAVGILDKSTLSDLAILFAAGCRLTWYSVADEIDFPEYQNMWIDSLTNFAFDHNQTKQDKK